MENQPPYFRPVMASAQSVDPAPKKPGFLAPDKRDSHSNRILQFAHVALRHPEKSPANVRTHKVQQLRSAWPRVRENGDLRPLCYEHHIEMELSQIPPNAGKLTRTPCYLCPELGCSVAYNRREGYFTIIPQKEYTERDIMPSVSCPRDGRLMYLAEIKPEKRSFRRWTCPRCKTSRTNGEECTA
jgi:hypothetical protein